jgi:hypothetical protein
VLTAAADALEIFFISIRIKKDKIRGETICHVNTMMRRKSNEPLK